MLRHEDTVFVAIISHPRDMLPGQGELRDCPPAKRPAPHGGPRPRRFGAPGAPHHTQAEIELLGLAAGPPLSTLRSLEQRQEERLVGLVKGQRKVGGGHVEGGVPGHLQRVAARGTGGTRSTAGCMHCMWMHSPPTCVYMPIQAIQAVQQQQQQLGRAPLHPAPLTSAFPKITPRQPGQPCSSCMARSLPRPAYPYANTPLARHRPASQPAIKPATHTQRSSISSAEPGREEMHALSWPDAERVRSAGD